jgi:lysophospholipase L1-like esterase
LIVFCLLGLLPQAHLSGQEQGPERWEDRIRKFEAADKKNPVEAGRILFVGSSSIAMWQDVADYFPDHKVLNRGFGGSQFSDLIYYADRVIYPYKPSKIFIYEGDNDVAAGDRPKDILKEAKKLRKMITKNLGKDVPVIFISPKPSVARWELEEKYLQTNALLKRYAEKKAHTEYADVWYPALDEDGMVFKHIFLKDNLHMNSDGYAIWKKVLKPYVEGR